MKVLDKNGQRMGRVWATLDPGLISELRRKACHFTGRSLCSGGLLIQIIVTSLLPFIIGLVSGLDFLFV